MAFKTGFSERLDELRFPSPRSPPVDASFSSHTPLSPPANMMSAFSRPTTDVRANLQRRFTTDAGKLSSWSFLNQQPTPPAESLDLLSSVSIPFAYLQFLFYVVVLGWGGGTNGAWCTRKWFCEGVSLLLGASIAQLC